jgi:hypothetical protein
MTGDYYYCADCELAYRFEDTYDYYAPGFPDLSGRRGCMVCADKLTWIDPDDIDCSIFDYVGEVNR